jgi:signal transduction histidine kinase
VRPSLGRLDPVDAVLALVVLGLGLLEYVVTDGRPVVEVVPLVALGALAVAARTATPVPAAALATAVMPLSVWVAPQEAMWPVLPALLALYTVGASQPVRAFAPTVGVTGLMLVLAAVQEPRGMDRFDLVLLALLLVGALAVGRAGREIHTEAEEVRREAARDRVAHEREVLAAAAEERLRIARELHDVLGHTVSVMGLQAAAVRRRLLPEQLVEAEALRTVEEIGREAVVELRRLLTALRSEAGAVDADVFEVEGLASSSRLEAVVAEVRAAGVDVEMSGAALVEDVAPAVALTVVRVVQEGLTNVLRHAPGATARVQITRGAEGLRVAVSDDGATSTTRSAGAGAGPGFGLVGLRERAAVFGGSLAAQSREGGGFDLQVTLPMVGA